MPTNLESSEWNKENTKNCLICDADISHKPRHYLYPYCDECKRSGKVQFRWSYKPRTITQVVQRSKDSIIKRKYGIE